MIRELSPDPLDGAYTCVVVMGVSGVGKTTVGRALATALHATFLEGDDLHPAANRAKLAAGDPLDDDDRWPWLDTIGRYIERHRRDGPVVVTCSALKRIYRDRLRRSAPSLRFVYLAANVDIVEARVKARTGHFASAALVPSQFAILEVPDPQEGAIHIDASVPLQGILDGVFRALQKRADSTR